MSSIRQNKVRFAVVLVFLLPALFYRALVPVGFMPMVGQGGALEIGLCPGVQDAVNVIFPAAIHGHHHDGIAPAHGEHPTACPYASSATPALAAAFSVSAAFVAVIEQTNASSSAIRFIPSVLRTQSPRAPPAPV